MMPVTVGNPCGASSLPSPASLLAHLHAAKNALEDASIAHCGASVAFVEAKRALELAEAYKLCEGVDGRNEKGRAAKLRLELAPCYTALAEAEDALTEARCAFEVTRLEWDLARYQLRAFEVIALPKAA
jgi:hypothetical protein